MENKSKFNHLEILQEEILTIEPDLGVDLEVDLEVEDKVDLEMIDNLEEILAIEQCKDQEDVLTVVKKDILQKIVKNVNLINIF